MTKRLYFILFMSLMAMAFHISAQEKDIKFHHITVDDGLPSNTVNSVIRDSRGFIWIASEKGVFRYYGFSFTKFLSNE